MSNKMPELPTYEFVVTTLVGDVVSDYEVDASYFQEAGAFVQLKDHCHVVVDAFRAETVLRVKRSEDPVDDA